MQILIWLVLMAALYHFAQSIFWVLVVINGLCFAIIGTAMSLAYMGVLSDKLTAKIDIFDRWWLPIYDRIIHWSIYLRVGRRTSIDPKVSRRRQVL